MPGKPVFRTRSERRNKNCIIHPQIALHSGQLERFGFPGPSPFRRELQTPISPGSPSPSPFPFPSCNCLGRRTDYRRLIKRYQTRFPSRPFFPRNSDPLPASPRNNCYWYLASIPPDKISPREWCR